MHALNWTNDAVSVTILSMDNKNSRTICVDGIRVEFTHKKIKNINIRVRRDGTVAVSAPRSVSEASAAAFVREKKSWIEKSLSRIGAGADIPERKYETGETIRIFGDTYRLYVSEGSRYDIRLLNGNAFMQVVRGSGPADRGRHIRKYYRKLLQAKLEERVPLWEERTGLCAGGWHVRDMKSRWGSCNTRTGEMCFNLKLVAYDIELIDYVVLHELAHLKHANHGREYWKLVSAFMPDCRARRKRLNSAVPDYRPPEECGNA